MQDVATPERKLIALAQILAFQSGSVRWKNKPLEMDGFRLLALATAPRESRRFQDMEVKSRKKTKPHNPFGRRLFEKLELLLDSTTRLLLGGSLASVARFHFTEHI